MRPKGPMGGHVSGLNYNALSEQTRKKIEALAESNGWSIDETLEEIGIEFVAMGGVTGMKKAKAELVHLGAKRAQERASKGPEEGK